MADDDILFGRLGGVATVTLNRPLALNAFTLDMYRRFDPMLRAWAEDPGIHAVLVQSAEGRAFCAGGDVRAIYEAGRGIAGDPGLTADFFREEYQLIRRIYRFPKPYISIIDGIAMGGGLGVSVNGAYRIATEQALFAMPETAIGLFPDVGATRFLNLCPGQIGRYLGLTGARIGPGDALECGIVTHFVRRERLAAVVSALSRVTWRANARRAQVDEVMKAFSVNLGAPPLAAQRFVIDRCFTSHAVEDIVGALAVEARAGGRDSDWAAETRNALLSKSPTSLKVTLRQLYDGLGLDVEEALILEYRLMQHVMAGHDFYEGVRAALVDKDQQPKWDPATLAEVTDEIVDAHFAPIGDRELRFD
jgi:enoyl-CoA hydratase